jgi:hypothetical protein
VVDCVLGMEACFGIVALVIGRRQIFGWRQFLILIPISRICSILLAWPLILSDFGHVEKLVEKLKRDPAVHDLITFNNSIFRESCHPQIFWKSNESNLGLAAVKTRIMRALGPAMCFGSHFPTLMKKSGFPWHRGVADCKTGGGSGLKRFLSSVKESFCKCQTITKSQYKMKLHTFSSSLFQSSGNKRSSEVGFVAHCWPIK